ncbi:nucleotide disphospho-sugar-binding domain-containing protein [Nonomuraea sp. NPDC050202]|jgi:UDP:flavonoid glycosyltransferase YjiC (YdhE family)|uniref:nucleotide disphospho-sugar-binding domain-containing protein n=1 Tax=Nonomuraea sp. NPDC050202 TaxID=3155035 RepID=UPI0033CA105A
MRVVFTTWAWPSHLYALVPLARACRAAGHEVVFASEPGLTRDVLRADLPAAVLGTDVDTAGMVHEYLLPLPGGPAPRREGKGPRVLRMLTAHAESMTGDLIRLIRDWRADLVVYDQVTLAGPIAAAATGVPAVRQLYGFDLLQRARGVLPDALAPLAERFGAGPVDPFGAATVDPVPASVQVPGDHRLLPMRYLPYNGPETTPWQPPEPPGRRRRPRVCVSWGHTIAKVDPSRFIADGIAAALAETGVDVVLAVSAAQLDLLAARRDAAGEPSGVARDLPGALPDGVRVVVDVPLRNVLRDCDAFVGHGGAGGILTALAHGVPMLLVPQLPDHAGHTGRVAAGGAAAVLSLAELTPAAVRDEVTRLLDDPEPRRAAGELREEMRSQAAPAEVAGALAGLRPSLVSG